MAFLRVNLRAKTHWDLWLILMQPVVLQVFKTHFEKLMLAFSKNSPLTDRPHGIQKPFRNPILKDKSSEINKLREMGESVMPKGRWISLQVGQQSEKD